MRTQFSSLVDFAQQLEKNRKAKEDYIVDSRALSVEADAIDKIQIDGQPFEMNRTFRQQLHYRLGIPSQYADRIAKDHPDIYAETVTKIAQRSGEKRMVRTIEGRARAYLSDRYSIVDNEPIADQMLPIMGQIEEAQFHGLAVTDDFMAIKVVAPRIHGDVKVGDTVQLGLSLRNSEVGDGAFKIEPLLYRLVCLNGMIREDDAWRQAHLGGRHESRGPAYKVDTRRAEAHASILKGRDVVTAMLTPDTLQSFLRPLREAAGVMLVEPTRAVERVVKLGSLTEAEGEGVLAHLIQGGDISKFGLVQAVTRYSQDIEDYDRADFFERLGSKVLNLPRSDFKELAAAA